MAAKKKKETKKEINKPPYSVEIDHAEYFPCRLEGYEVLCLETANSNLLSHRHKVDNFSIGLFGEAGELADYLKKVIYHGHELDTDIVIKEMGDILWYCVATMDAINQFRGGTVKFIDSRKAVEFLAPNMNFKTFGGGGEPTFSGFARSSEESSKTEVNIEFPSSNVSKMNIRDEVLASIVKNFAKSVGRLINGLDDSNFDFNGKIVERHGESSAILQNAIFELKTIFGLLAKMSLVLDIEFNEVAERNIKKLRKRYEDGKFTREGSIARVDVSEMPETTE